MILPHAMFFLIFITFFNQSSNQTDNQGTTHVKNEVTKLIKKPSNQTRQLRDQTNQPAQKPNQQEVVRRRNLYITVYNKGIT